MSGAYRGLNQAQIDRRLKEGRGQGTGSSYKPFIYTYDVSSLGRSHRLFGRKCTRMHHLLSDLELAVFLILDWSPSVIDIREQFPLRVDDTVRIAEELGIRHASFKGVNQILSSDFLVDTNDSSRPTMAFQVKYSCDLEKPETIERLMLEKKYWAEKEIPWSLITEKEISKVAFANIEWLYPTHMDDVQENELLHYFGLFQHEFALNPDKKLTAIAQNIDMAYKMELGESLYWLKHLLARSYFLFDITKSYRELIPAMLIENNHMEYQENSHASG